MCRGGLRVGHSTVSRPDCFPTSGLGAIDYHDQVEQFF